MFVNIQFPFVDIRYFNNENTGKLKTPDLPIYNFVSRKQFVRNFGSVRQRSISGIGYDENAYVDAGHAVKLLPEGIREFNASDSLKFGSIWFKRLFYDGRANYRVEIGLSCYIKEDEACGKYKLEHIVDKVLSLKTKAAKSEKAEELGKSLRSIIPLYLKASTSSKATCPDELCLLGANPMVYMEVSLDDFTIPKNAHLVSQRKFGDFDLYNMEKEYDRIPYSIWIVAYDSKEYLLRSYKNKYYARNLRLALMRQNFERECLKQVLLCACMGKIQANSMISDYINRCDYIRKVIYPQSEQMKYNLTYKNLILYIHRYQRIIDPNLEQMMLDISEGYLSEIKEKIKRLIKIEVKGDLVMGNQNNVKTDGDGNMIFVQSEVEGGVKRDTTTITKTVMPEDIMKLFESLREKAKEAENTDEINTSIDAMEEEYGKPTFGEKVKDFLFNIAGCMPLFIPFIEKLTKIQ